jgi:sulfide:quinone oxidoreductase
MGELTGKVAIVTGGSAGIGRAAAVGRWPGLGDELGFVPTDAHTLQSRVSADIFVIGDASDVPTSKAGSVAHFEGEIVAENVRRHLLRGDRVRQRAADRLHLRHRAAPRPLPLAGGAALLQESRLAHLGKRSFEPYYRQALLPGRGG